MEQTHDPELGLSQVRCSGRGYRQRGDCQVGVRPCRKYVWHPSDFNHSANPHLGPGSRPITEEEQALITQRAKWSDEEGGYNHIQGTKPQTLAYGLNDSPAGLASWIVEKYRTWSDCGGDVEKRYTKDELLTIVTIYWVTQTISSSTRMYFENQKNLWVMDKDQKVPAPAGMAMFPQEISKPPREWGERSYDVRRWTEMTKGGHFAALEEPQLLAEEVRAFFREFR